MSGPRLAGLLAGMLCLLLAAAVAGSYALSLHAIDRSDQQWCSSLLILTYKPVVKPANPSANKSQQEVYELYESLLRLERVYGCRH